jgi:hypothetical protein
MKDIKINILGITDNNDYWQYDIIINGKRFISGWYRYTIWQFYYDKNMDQYIKRVYCKYDNTLSKREVQKIKRECVLILTDKPFYVKGVTQEIIDFIIEQIKLLYKDVINNFQG